MCILTLPIYMALLVVGMLLGHSTILILDRGLSLDKSLMEGIEVLILVMVDDSHLILNLVGIIGNLGQEIQILELILFQNAIFVPKEVIQLLIARRGLLILIKLDKLLSVKYVGNEVIVPWIVIIRTTFLIKAHVLYHI